MEAFWGFFGIGLCGFLFLAGYALVIKAQSGNEKTPSSEEVSDDKKE